MKTQITIEERIASKAVAALYAHTGLQLELLDKNSVLGTGLWPDMRFRISGTQHELVCEVKAGLSQESIKSVVRLLQSAVEGRPALIIANYIEVKVAQILRELQINYIDASGNAYINLPPFFVFIQGQAIVDGLTQRKPAKPFSITDLQIIYALLAKPNLLNENYREVSECANVALGVCGSAFRNLKDQGYFVEAVSTKKREWRERHKLIGRWVEQYPTLRRKAFLGEYFAPSDDWLQSDKFNHYDVQLGGGLAASRYLDSTVDNGVSVYVNDQQQWQFIRELGLTKGESSVAKETRVNVFSKFWGANLQSAQDSISSVIHPLIAYAELIENNNEASRSAANEIASRYFV